MEALRNHNRVIHEVRCSSEQIKNAVQQIRPDLRVNIVDQHQLLKITRGLHQGIALCCEPIKIHKKLDKSLLTSNILVLDHLQDVTNIGSIMRSMVAMNFRILITSQRGVPNLEQAAIKTACGALEYLTIFQVANIRQCIADLKRTGFWCVGLDHEGIHSVNSINEDRLAIIIGSEGDGIQGLVKKECDQLVRLSTAPDFPVLNASVAAAVAMYIMGSP